MFKLGTVINYLPKTQIAIIQLSADLFIHEKIKFVFEKYTLFEQVVDEIRLDYKKVDFAKAGSVVGIHIDMLVLGENGKIETGTEIFRS